MFTKKYYNFTEESWSINQRGWQFSSANEYDPDTLREVLIELQDESWIRGPSTNLLYNGIQEHCGRISKLQGMMNRGQEFDLDDIQYLMERSLRGKI